MPLRLPQETASGAALLGSSGSGSAPLTPPAVSRPDHNDTESTPLLLHRPSQPTVSRYRYILILCGLLVVVTDLSAGLSAATEVRLLEKAVCR